MPQVTLRMDADLARRLKHAAEEAGESVNAYAGAVLRAAVDPDFAGDEADQLRARLAQAGVLAADIAPAGRRPAPDALERARRRASSGQRLSDLVGEGR